MFKRSRRKIVASILLVLVFLWMGTLGLIYTSSYLEVSRENLQMLKEHAQRYVLPHGIMDFPPEPDLPNPNPGNRGFRDSPMFQLSVFYTIAFSADGTVLDLQNDPPTIHSDESLEQLARTILKENQISGSIENLAFYQTQKNGFRLVVFKDNTVIRESAATLIRYTLLFGGVMLVLFFFLAIFLARKIVQPLEESYQKQKQFISDAGHELKTPVSVVSVNAELLSREIGSNPWLSNIQYENERMGMLVGQLLSLARAEHPSVQFEQVDFSRLVEGEALPFESVAFEKGLVLQRDIPGAVIVEGDSTQLKQLVSILLDNAIRHSDGGQTVSLRLFREHGLVHLCVVNHGAEIPKEQRERLFERFYRVDSARNGEDRHYGLGLSIAKAIVSTHKGDICVSCYDELVELHVRLPAV